jgi:hypothetical protein
MHGFMARHGRHRCCVLPATRQQRCVHLPALPFITARDLLRRVGADCAIEVDANDYSVPWRLSTLRAGYTDGIHRLDPAQQARLRRTLKL